MTHNAPSHWMPSKECEIHVSKVKLAQTKRYSATVEATVCVYIFIVCQRKVIPTLEDCKRLPNDWRIKV